MCNINEMDRAIQTLTEMVNQREYKIIVKEDDRIIGCKTNGDKIVVFLEPVIKFNVDRFKEYVGKLEQLNSSSPRREYTEGIVIYIDCVTPTGKRMIKESFDVHLQLFSIDEIQFNITKHRLVPTHIKLEEKESKEFKKKFGLKHPAILTTDPVSRFYGYKRGDVVKIVRSNGFITYRIVKG